MANKKNTLVGSAIEEKIAVKADDNIDNSIDNKKNKKTENLKNTNKENAVSKKKQSTSKKSEKLSVSNEEISEISKNENIAKTKKTSLNKENKVKNESYYKEKAKEIEVIINAKLNANPAIKETFKLPVSLNKFIETGIHIGLPSWKWNPKMKQYIHTKKGKNYIIDIFHTIVGLNKAINFLTDLTKNGGKALFVATKSSASNTIIKDQIKYNAKRAGSFYVNQRWLGGTLTNFKTICNSTKKLSELAALQKFGKLDKYTKKEQVSIINEIEKLNKFFGGIRTMKELPNVIILSDPVVEKNAVLEAKKLNIPVIAICNTNSDPTLIDIPIPGNNYSIKSVWLIMGILADAICIAEDKPTAFINKKDEEIIFPVRNQQ